MEAKTNYSQVYILMVILLILSQDDMNNEAIQKIVKYNSKLFAKPFFFNIILSRLFIISLGLQSVHY
jgi:hypothetical protein